MFPDIILIKKAAFGEGSFFVKPYRQLIILQTLRKNAHRQQGKTDKNEPERIVGDQGNCRKITEKTKHA